MAKRRCAAKKCGSKRACARKGCLKGKGAKGLFKKLRKPVKFAARVLKENSSDPEVRKAASVLGKLASGKKSKQSKGAETVLKEAIIRAGI